MLTLGIYDSPTGPLLLDCSTLARGMRVRTNEHGFADLSCFLPLSIYDAFRLYDRAAFPHVALTWNGMTVWEGRLEDPTLSFGEADGGLSLRAFGYQRALADAPYTALWSTTRLEEFQPVTTSPAGRAPERHEYDKNGRLYIAPRKNEQFSTSKYFSWRIEVPDKSDKTFVAVSFDYSFFASSSWVVQFTNSGTVFWSLAGNGALQTGTQTLTFAADTAVYFTMYYNSGTATTYSGETGDYYASFTNIRLKGTTSSNVYADEIARALAAYVNGINPAQLQNVTALIESPALDLRHEVYEDLYPNEILDYLVGLGDSQTPPRQWEWGVWENRILHFRPRGSQGLQWYADVGEFDVDRTISELWNSAYGVYQEAGGRALRTAASTDVDSVARYAVTRRAPVKVQTTNAAQAQTHRDTFLADRKDAIPRVGIRVKRLYTPSGALAPNWMARSGDQITIRNLPATASSGIDRIRTFRVKETDYDVDNDELLPVPEAPRQSLDVMVARERAFA